MKKSSKTGEKLSRINYEKLPHVEHTKVDDRCLDPAARVVLNFLICADSCTIPIYVEASPLC